MELSNSSTAFKTRIQEKEPEIQKIKLIMKSSLIECYQKNYTPIERVKRERITVQQEASKLKTEAQQIIRDCMMSEDRPKCSQQRLSRLGKKTDKLLKKFKSLVKKETETRVYCTKLMLECDKKAINNAEKKILKIIEKIIKSTE